MHPTPNSIMFIHHKKMNDRFFFLCIYKVMGILSSLSKDQLIEIAQQSSTFKTNMKKNSKKQLIEFIEKHDLPLIEFPIVDLKKKELMDRALQKPGFIRAVHGRTKSTLCEFLGIHENGGYISPLHFEDIIDQNEMIDEKKLRAKILECFTNSSC